MLREIRGSYMPSAFSIFLNIMPQELDTHGSTFVHEYIHFLQDLLLPYCIRHNLVFINDFAWISKVAETRQKISRPFDEWSDDCKLTTYQQNFTWGNGPSNSGKIIDIQQESFTSSYGHRIFRYFLIFDDGTKYQFGARDFLEYLAHKVQNHFWKINAPDLPYKTIDKVLEYFKLDYIPEPVRLAIAEYCLYNDNPAHLLINMFIKQELIEHNQPNFLNYDICTQFLLGVGWESNGGFSESIQSKTERRLNDFVHTLIALYPHRQFDSIKEWIVSTNKFCKSNLSNKFVISSLYNLSKDGLFQFIEHMLCAVGIPMVIFKDDTITTSMLPPQYEANQFVEFYVLLSFVEWVKNNERGCPIRRICEKNYNMCQPVCSVNPTTFSGECWFRLFLQSYGFDQYSFECH